MSTFDPSAPQDVQAVQRIVAACERCAVTLDPATFAVNAPQGTYLGTATLMSDPKGLYAVYVRPADAQNKRQTWHVTAARIERFDPGEDA